MTMKTGLVFDPEKHEYTLDGQPVVGVTTALGVLNKPALPKWAANTVAEYVADNMPKLRNLAAHGRNNIIRHLKEIPWQKRDDAAQRGTQLHLYAEDLLRGKPIPIDFDDPLFPVVQHAERFLKDWQIDPLLIEAPVASRRHGYAGTGDLIARYTNPHTGETGTAILDWKSSKRIYPDHAFQMAAYAHADFTGLAGDEQPIPSVDAAFGVHITPSGTRVYPVESGERVFQEFLTILHAYRIKQIADGDWRVPGSGYVKEHYQGRKQR